MHTSTSNGLTSGQSRSVLPLALTAFFASAMGVSLLIEYGSYSTHQYLAEHLAHSVRNRILVQDNRTAISSLQSSIHGQFRSADLTFASDPTNPIRIFESTGSLPTLPVRIPIRFNETLRERSPEAANLVFLHEIGSAWPIHFLIWTLLAIVTFLVVIRMQRDFEQRARQSEAMTKAELRMQLAAQVAHDIRAPLAALTVLEGEIGVLPENTRVLLKTAMDRIKGIAESLIESERTEIGAGAPHSVQEELTQVTPLLESSFSEAKLRFRLRPEIEFRSEISTPLELQARIPAIDFARVVSNLMGNACEAISDSGTVTLRAGILDHSTVVIEIADTGKGIPQENLAKLGHRGATFGKSGGSGLGLYHARTTVESWGGRLEIRSVVGQGTRVQIKLPREIS